MRKTVRPDGAPSRLGGTSLALRLDRLPDEGCRAIVAKRNSADTPHLITRDTLLEERMGWAA
jgi:hypothetical protein